VLAAAGARAAPAGTDEELRVTLNEALALALDHAFHVKAAQHDSLAAEQGLRAARSAWWPNVSVTGNAIGLRPEDALSLGLFEIAPEWHSIYVANLSLRYPIFVGGRRISEIRRTRETLGAADAGVDAARLLSAYQCRQAYVGLLLAERMVRAAEASLERVEIIRRDVDNLFASGMADSVDVLETELSIRRMRRLLEDSRNERRNASATLARRLGVAADRTIVPTEPVPTPDPESDTRLAGPEPPVDRPELTALAHQIEAARYQYDGVKADYWPAVNGLGGLSVVRPDLGQPGVDWRDIWFVGLSLSWQLNIGGTQFAQSAAALEQMKSLEMTRKDLEDSLSLQSRIAWNNIQKAYAVYEISRDEFQIARRQFGLAKDTAEHGRLSVNRLLELEAELTQTEQEFETARLRYFAAVTEYLYAIGSEALWEGM
jgi:outer membrane protein TolC